MDRFSHVVRTFPRTAAYLLGTPLTRRVSGRCSCVPAPPRTLSFTIKHAANRGADATRKRLHDPSIFGGSELCSASPKRVFRASPRTLILRTPNCLRSLSGHSSGFEDVSSDLKPKSVRF